jgi:hypothetical protein
MHQVIAIGTCFADANVIPSPVLPRKEERVRSDEVETLDIVRGEGHCSRQEFSQTPNMVCMDSCPSGEGQE